MFLGVTAVLVIWLFLTSRSDREAEQEFRKRYYARRRARVAERLPPPQDAGVPAPEAPSEEAR